VFDRKTIPLLARLVASLTTVFAPCRNARKGFVALPAACCVVLAALQLFAGSAAAQLLTEFSAGIPPAPSPRGTVLGPDGNIWFSEETGNRIGRITPAGVVT